MALRYQHNERVVFFQQSVALWCNRRFVAFNGHNQAVLAPVDVGDFFVCNFAADSDCEGLNNLFNLFGVEGGGVGVFHRFFKQD